MIPYASIILAVTPLGVVLVRDSNKPAPIYWKLPGGKSNTGETAQHCAVRELKEETGICAEEENLKMISSQDKGSHVKVFFSVRVASIDSLKQVGDEGEEVRLFSREALMDMIKKGEFFPPHSRIVEKSLAHMR